MPTITDVDNHYDTLKNIANAVPDQVSIAKDIQVVLITIDNAHDQLLSATSNEKMQKHWTLGQLMPCERCGVTFATFGGRHQTI